MTLAFPLERALVQSVSACSACAAVPHGPQAALKPSRVSAVSYNENVYGFSKY